MTEIVHVTRLKKVIALINSTIMGKLDAIMIFEQDTALQSAISLEFLKASVEELTKIRDDLMSTIVNSETNQGESDMTKT